MHTYTRTPDQAVEVDGLAVSYGSVTALDGLHLRVAAGTVFGLLGPNGAGKTTLVRVPRSRPGSSGRFR
jgi:ABC-2 type transport system ATP-binding protein